MEKEIWKDVVGYEGIYQVSNYGNVKSLERTRKGKNNSVCVQKEKRMKPNMHHKGRLMFGLRANSKTTLLYRYRLVADAFIPNPENKPEVNHVNGVKTDDYVANLEWATRKENMVHARGSGLFPKNHNKGEKHGKAILTKDDVKDIRKLEGIKTIREISKMYPVTEAHISNIIKRHVWQ